MTTPFESALAYVLENEGHDTLSDRPADRGGKTRWGVTEELATAYGFDVETLAYEQAKLIYKKEFWRFDGIRDRRLSTKLFDIVVNVGDPWRLIQRAFGAEPDGIYGEKTEAAILRVPTEEAIERLCLAVADKYTDIIRGDRLLQKAIGKLPEKERERLQLHNMRGWMRRAARRPPITLPQPPVEQCSSVTGKVKGMR